MLQPLYRRWSGWPFVETKQATVCGHWPQLGMPISGPVFLGLDFGPVFLTHSIPLILGHKRKCLDSHCVHRIKHRVWNPHRFLSFAQHTALPLQEGLVTRPGSSLHISAALDDAGGVGPPLNIPDILSSARLASAADSSPIYTTNFRGGTLDKRSERTRLGN
jgi:hypothetical protein